MSAIDERERALSILALSLISLSKLYKECYLLLGRGALLVDTRDIIDGKTLTGANYRTRGEMLDIFDEPSSRSTLARLIDNYDQKMEGVIALITSCSNATFFVTVKFNTDKEVEFRR